MDKKILFLLLLPPVIALSTLFFFELHKNKSYLIIDGNKIAVEIAKTEKEKTQGLSGRKSLAQNAGMLFVYENPVMPGFWMKDMRFPIDIIWIDANKKIVDITEYVTPTTFPQTFSPQTEAQYVLEVNANWAKTHNISIGDMVKFQIDL